MEEVKLVEVSDNYSQQIWQYRQELIDIKDTFDGTGNLYRCHDVNEFIDHCHKSSDIQYCLENNKVEATLYLLVDSKDNLLGMIDFRHNINHPVLNSYGGHIGYNVRPKYRRQGYGTFMLHLCLDKCREFGLDKIMVTCLSDNIASKKIIVANGGIYEKDVIIDAGTIERYWIRL